MKHEQTKRAKRIEWVSLAVDVAVCSHFAGFIASMFVFLKARSLRSLTSKIFWPQPSLHMTARWLHCSSKCRGIVELPIHPQLHFQLSRIKKSISPKCVHLKPSGNMILNLPSTSRKCFIVAVSKHFFSLFRTFIRLPM